MYKVVSNAKKTKYSIKGNWKSYTYWKYLKDYGKKFASTSLNHYQGLMEWTLS